MFGAPGGALACSGQEGDDSRTVARIFSDDRLDFSGNVRPPSLSTNSLGLDVRGFDQRPPFLDLGLMECAQRLGRLLLAWIYLLAKLGEPRTHRRIGQSINNCGVELG